jgi:iron complex outermembrane recepter protein
MKVMLENANTGYRGIAARVASCTLIVLAAGASMAFGADQTVLPDFGALSLDQLANIKITSFTRKQQTLSQVAGAVYVITQEQIARSGLTSVPELLRLAPGLDVAQVNGNQWSVSARGPVGVYSNKLLVMIDGRSIYSAVFSGVYWELGMPLLDDIERIEVIRGPGATIWGANAVLGVINIITKSSRDTHGTTITSGAGSSERAFGSARMGGVKGLTGYRVYVGGSGEAPLSRASGADADDARSSVQGGFRLDGSHRKYTWMLEGDLFRGVENNTGINPSVATRDIVESPAHFETSAGNLTGELRRRLGETGELRLQSSFDFADRPEPQASEVETRTWDTELQYDFKVGNVNNLSVGGGERLIANKVSPGGEVTFSPTQLTYANLNAFVQDEMHFAHDALLVTVGAKLEHNHFGGRGLEPSANMLWMPTKQHSLWISAARPLRTPSLFEIGVDAPYTIYPASAATGGLPILSRIDGSAAFSAESVKDFEAGYRGQMSKTFSTDLTVFYDQLSNVRSFIAGNPVFDPSPVPHLEVVALTGNGAASTAKGAEGSIAWQVLPEWKLQGSYTYDIVNSWLSSSAVPGSVYAGGKQPSRNKWGLQSYVSLSRSWTLDSFLYWTSQASPQNTFGPDILVPSYTRLDIRLGYKAGRHWQLGLAGQNLLQARHLEALAELLSAHSYVKRGVYLKSTWQF